MKKISLLILISLMIMSLVGMVSATEMDTYSLSRWYGNSEDTTYNSYHAPLNGVDYNDLSFCSVGYGTDKGTYPVSLNQDGDYYSFLVVPTDNAVRIINSNCTEINTITISNVNFYGTMSTFVEQSVSGKEQNKFILLGHDTVSDMYSFYSFKFNESSETIEFEEKVDIGVGVIDTLHFNGIACGWETESLNSEGGCGLVSGTTLYYWNISNDNILTYTTPVNVERNRDIENPLSWSSGVETRSFDTVPYGAVVDMDNDNNNEMFFGAVTGDDSSVSYNFFGFDMVSKTFQFSYSIDALQNYEFVGQPVAPIQPCQIGGRVSNMEICISSRAYQPSALRYELSYEIFDISGNSLFSLNPTHRNIIPIATFDYDDDDEYEFIAGKHIYDSNYLLIDTIDDYVYDTSSRYDSTYAQPSYVMDITGDGQEEIIIGNGSTYYWSTTAINYTFSAVSETQENYIVAGDLNRDFKNEIIFSNPSNIYIYSTNPTDDYIEYGETTYYAYDLDGLNYETSSVTYNGSVTGGVATNDTVYFDNCFDVNILNEGFLFDNEVSALAYNCVTNGYDNCVDGACVYINDTLPDGIYYDDTDGGISYYTKGTVYNYTVSGGVSMNDTLFEDVCSDNNLLEYHIVTNSFASLIFDCESVGYICLDGECIEEYVPPEENETTLPSSECRDSDGNNPKSAGNINTNIGVFYDICVSSDIVTEYICDNGVAMYEDYNCVDLGYDYCENGKCRNDIYLESSSLLVDVDNPEDSIDVNKATGLLPDVYHGVLEFFRNSIKPILGFFVIIMIFALIWGIKAKIERSK